MRYEAIKGDHLTKILGPWNVGVRVNNMVFTSGQAAVDSQGNVIGVGDIRLQTKQTIENIKATLETAGASLEDVVSATIWLTDWRDYEGYNEVYSEYFGPNFPPRATLQSPGMAFKDLLVEIQCIAIVDGRQ